MTGDQKRKQGVKNEIRNTKEETKKKDIEQKLEHLEFVTHDIDKYYQACRDIQHKKRNATLCVQDDDDKILGRVKEQVEAISSHFKRMLAHYPPTPMSISFKASEVAKASVSMKNNKSCGMDNMHAEHIKYAPPHVHESIASIYNNIAESGNSPTEIKTGEFIPLLKPGKPKGPHENLNSAHHVTVSD